MSDRNLICTFGTSPKLLAELDKLSKKLGKSRSTLIREAIRSLMKEHKKEEKLQVVMP